MKIITYALLGITLFTVLYVILLNLLRRRLSLKDRLSDIEAISREEETGLDVSALTGKRGEDEKIYHLPFVGFYLKSTADQLLQAHLLIKPLEFLLMSFVAAISLFLLIYILNGNLFLAFMSSGIGFFLPKIMIMRSRDKRKRALSDQLPEFLNILSNALRAGLSFNQALATAGDEMRDPIRWEFQKVLRDYTLGRPLDEALNDLARRTGDEDMEMFVSAIIIQRQVGGNISEILDMIANTIRERVKLKGEVRTLSAQNRMSAIIIGSLPIGIAMVLSVLNPEYLKPLFTETLGQIMAGGAMMMILIGAFLLKEITTLEV